MLVIYLLISYTYGLNGIRKDSQLRTKLKKQSRVGLACVLINVDIVVGSLH
jgi:hypothetical protein